ncbi:MAG TPA: thioredoxin fold domain-containing protein [Puia sp.]
MKRLLCLTLLLPVVLMAQEKGIQFQQGLSWQEVQAKAKAENKYIFVDCLATWCRPCEFMDKDVYPSETVGAYLNDKFISVKVQMDTAKGDNEQVKSWYADAHNIMQQYKITAFPSFLFFSPDGRIVHRDQGYIKADDFITLASDACNPDKQYYTLLESYQQGRLDTAYMKSLARKANSLDEKELAAKIANKYINALKEEELFTVDNIWFMYDFTKSSKDKGFVVFRDNAAKIYQVERRIEEKQSKDLVINIIYNEEIKPYEKSKNGKPDEKKIEANIKKYGALGHETYTVFKPRIIFKLEIEPALKANPDWNKIQPIIKKQNAGKGEEFLVGSSIIYYLNGLDITRTEKNCKNLIGAASVYIKKYPSFLRADPLNTWAWLVFEHSSKKSELSTAISWSKRAVEAEPNDLAYLDTYANLLYKVGRIQEAITWEEKAEKLEEDKAAISKRAPNEVYRVTLEKMRKGEKTWLAE